MAAMFRHADRPLALGGALKRSLGILTAWGAEFDSVEVRNPDLHPARRPLSRGDTNAVAVADVDD